MTTPKAPHTPRRNDPQTRSNPQTGSNPQTRSNVRPTPPNLTFLPNGLPKLPEHLASLIDTWGWNRNAGTLLSLGVLGAFFLSAFLAPLVSAACLIPGVLGHLAWQQRPNSLMKPWLSDHENSTLLGLTVLITGVWMSTAFIHPNAEDFLSSMLKTLMGLTLLYITRHVTSPIIEPHLKSAVKFVRDSAEAKSRK